MFGQVWAATETELDAHDRWLKPSVSRGSFKKNGLIVLRKLWAGAGSHSGRARIRIALLALAIFILDTTTDVDIAIPVLYVIVVLLAMRSGRSGDVVLAGWGSIVLIVVSFALTLDPGRPVATSLLNSALSVLATGCVTLLCVRNITSQTEVVRARDRIALVSRGISLKTLSASVVHEVTQPLTAIGANADAAHRWISLSPPNLDETKAATRRIVAEAQRASSVIDRLRRFTAVGQVTTDTCDLLALIERALAHLALEFEEANVNVSLECPTSLRVSADAILIEQVIINALSNSLDALRVVEANTRSLAVEAKQDSERVQIAIKDDGIGVDGSTLERIFDLFFTTKVGSGMGIGLAMSRSIIDAHGGRIYAFPNKPRGLVVEFTLPTVGPDIQ